MLFGIKRFIYGSVCYKNVSQMKRIFDSLRCVILLKHSENTTHGTTLRFKENLNRNATFT